MSETDLYYGVLCAHIALSGEIESDLRAVFIKIIPENYVFEVNYYFDCEITDEVIDASRDATSYLSGSYSWAFGNEIAHYLEWLYPKPFPENQGICAYLRHEESAEGVTNSRDQALKTWEKVTEELENNMQHPTVSLIACFFQKAFLGRIVPSLRAATITLNKENRTIDSFFVFDGVITPLFYQLIKLGCQEVQNELPIFDNKWHIERLDYPKRIGNKGERSFYQRKEPMD